MKLLDFLQKTNLDNSLLIGYYGGGNYGDELLLEVLSNLLARRGVNNMAITYQRPETYKSMHHDFGFKLINIYDRLAVIKAALTSRNILIGGGGLWGVDINFNTLLLSLFLFISRWALRKKIYLLGVGYYGSTSWMGRLAAWLAGKAANVIIVRDEESVTNFGRLHKHVYQDSDIAWYIPRLDLASYTQEANHLQQRMPVGDKTLLLALRRPQAKSQSQDFVRFNKLINWLIKSNPAQPVILLMPESDVKNQSLHKEIRGWRRLHKNLRIIEMPYNPLALYLYIKQNKDRLSMIAPQLHLIMTAHLTNVPFLPVAYDNKVSQLLDQIGIPHKKRLTIRTVTGYEMQEFADGLGGAK
jgi:polysaccharide pyruvyl transferase WcaK-like protein